MRVVQLLAAAAVVFSASPAAAAITLITLTGVASGQDNGHINAPSPFGAPQLGGAGSSGETFGVLTDAAFTLVLRIDDSLGDVDSFPDGDSRYGSGAQSPLSATFTLGGNSYDFGNASSVVAKAFLTPDQFFGEANELRIRPPMTGDFTNVTGHLDFNLIFASQVFQDRTFGEPVSWTRGLGDNATGNLALSLQKTSGTELVFVLGPTVTADLDLTFNTLSVAAVPEPATWAMMIAGFGLAGTALRRRRALAT